VKTARSGTSRIGYSWALSNQGLRRLELYEQELNTNPSQRVELSNIAPQSGAALGLADAVY
jgi:hypothetical protein